MTAAVSALNAKKKTIAQCVRFDEDFNVLDLGTEEGSVLEIPEDRIETVRRALVMGIKDFAEKTGFKKVHLGLSGGVDSAVVACLAADALGPMNVQTLGMEGPYTTPESVQLAKQLADNLGLGFKELSIIEMYRQTVKEFEAAFGIKEFRPDEPAIQARLRGVLLMAYSNRENSLLLRNQSNTKPNSPSAIRRFMVIFARA